MNIEIKRIIAIAVLFVLAFACHAGVTPEPNESNIVKAELPTENTKVNSTATHVPEKQKPADQIEAELAKEYYKDCVQNLKWALGIIVALLVGFVGYAIFKSGREYRETLADVKQALGDAREACSEARAASDKAREYEEKAEQRLASIDEQVTEKLKEIEAKGKGLVTELIEEAEKQRKMSKLHSQGLSAYEREQYERATDCFIRELDIDPNNLWALIDLAAALAEIAQQKYGPEAEKLAKQACEKLQKAVQINPDVSEAYFNWGSALIALARTKENEERRMLLKEAEEKCLKGESIKKGAGAYNLACVSALLDNEEECKRWLKIGEEANSLLTRRRAMSDPDLKSVRSKEWFRQIHWADDKEENSSDD